MKVNIINLQKFFSRHRAKTRMGNNLFQGCAAPEDQAQGHD